MFARARRLPGTVAPGVLDGKLIVVGDSNSAVPGQNGTTSWATMIAADYPLLTVSTSAAVGGATAADWDAAKATDIYPQFDSGKRFNLVVLMAGTNDVATTSDSAATIYGYLSSIITGCLGQGFKVIVGTIFWGAGYDAGQITRLDATNALISGNAAGAGRVSSLRSLVGTDGANYSDNFHLSNPGQTITSNENAAKAKEIV